MRYPMAFVCPDLSEIARYAIGYAALVLGLSLSAGCGAGQPPRNAAPDKEAAPKPAYLDIVENRCATCHDGTQRLAIGEAALHRDPSLALRAALMISAERMPPSPQRLSRTERDTLISGLCGAAAKDPATCVRSLGARPRVSSILAASELLRAIDAKQPPGATAGHPSVGEELLRSHDANGATDTIIAPALDPTYAAALLVVAGERCTSQNGREGASPEYDHCLRGILDADLAKPPQPAVSNPSSSEGEHP